MTEASRAPDLMEPVRRAIEAALPPGVTNSQAATAMMGVLAMLVARDHYGNEERAMRLANALCIECIVRDGVTGRAGRNEAHVRQQGGQSRDRFNRKRSNTCYSGRLQYV